jgi:hypothetical protein
VLLPSNGFATPYPAGSAVFEVSSDTYRLESGADGSRTLVRQTAAGAVQPLVDNISELGLEASRFAGRLTRVDLTVRLGTRALAPGRQISDRFLRMSVALRNQS